MKQTEIRNLLGIYDDPFLNAACECEEREELAEIIAKKIIKEHGFSRGLYNGDIFSFKTVCDILLDFGFSYVNSCEESESHSFLNAEKNITIDIFPKTFYPCQDKFRFDNFILY